MGNAPITAEMMTEAGIAAHLTLHPNLIPPEIAELSDQAAIFASNNVNIFKFTGAADADSEATNIGTSVAVKAIERAIEIDERRKREENSADADVIAAAGQAIREDLAELQQVTYSDGQFQMFGMDIDEEDMDASVADTLDNINEVAIRHGLDAQQTANLTSLLVAYQNADSPEEKAEILEQIADAHPNVARDMANDAAQASEARNQSELDVEEVVQRDISAISDDDTFRAVALETATETEVDMAELARSGMSASGNPFEAGFSPSAEFNAQGLEANSFADAEPPQTTPMQPTSESALELRV